jgi:hypothetical protein
MQQTRLARITHQGSIAIVYIAFRAAWVVCRPRLVRDAATWQLCGSCFGPVWPPRRAPSTPTAAAAASGILFAYRPGTSGGAASRHHCATYRVTAPCTRSQTSRYGHTLGRWTNTRRGLVTTTAATFHNR